MLESGGVPDPDNVPGHIVKGQLLVIVKVEETIEGNSKNMIKVESNNILFSIIRSSFLGTRGR